MSEARVAGAVELAGKTAVVTGASSGIGTEIARGLASRGARVVLAVRNVAKGEVTRRALAESTGNDLVEVLELDLARFASVRRAAGELVARHPAIHVLVNNAGIHTAHRVVTVDGNELTFQSNHLGHFLFTNLVLDALKRGAPSRVVIVASEAHRFGRVLLDDLDRARIWSGIGAYAQSKLANILHARELARRVQGSGVSVFATHPGSVRSRWARGPESGAFRVLVAMASPFEISPARGARTPLHCAIAPGLERESGGYFVRSKRVAPTSAGRDDGLAHALWVASEARVGRGEVVEGGKQA